MRYYSSRILGAERRGGILWESRKWKTRSESSSNLLKFGDDMDVTLEKNPCFRTLGMFEEECVRWDSLHRGQGQILVRAH